MSISVEGRLPDESPELQEVLREVAQALEPTEGWIFRGNGSPEGKITAARGALYLRMDGGAATSIYVKESGAGATGWVAK